MQRPGFLTPRFVGAALGVLASIVTCTVILYQLLHAAAPVPTTLQLINEAGTSATVRTAELAGRPVAGQPMRLSGPSDGSSGQAWTSAPVALEPGRPVDVKVVVADQTAPAQCTLDPRPGGLCTVRARYKGTAEMYCDYDCKPAPVR